MRATGASVEAPAWAGRRRYRASLLVRAPKLQWMLFLWRGQPQDDVRTPRRLGMLMEILEWLGRMTDAVIPFLFRKMYRPPGKMSSQW